MENEEENDDDKFYDAHEPYESPSLAQINHPRRSKRKQKQVTHLMLACTAALAAFSPLIDNTHHSYHTPMKDGYDKIDLTSSCTSPEFVIEEELLPCSSLQSKAHNYMQQHLQLIDSLEDMKSNDWSFIPEAILEHRISFKPRRKVIPSCNSNEPLTIKIYRSCHIRLRVWWKTGEVSWISMDPLKYQNPWVIMSYVKNRKLQNHQDFAWINKYETLAKDIAQLFKANKAQTKGNKSPKFKFGIQVPNDARHAFQLDKMLNQTLWKEAVDNELGSINDFATFCILEEGEELPEGYIKIPYHFVFDVKFDLRHKARLVAGGHRTPDVPAEEIYSGVVSVETIRMAFILAAMNNLDVCAADISTAFLYGKTREKVYVVAGPEFGEHAGKRMIIDKGLYGLKTSAARFHEHLSAKLRRMGFKPSKADFDLFYCDRRDHYEYVATYVDDILAFSRDPMKIINEIQDDYVLKGIGTPEYYLGGDFHSTKDLSNMQEVGHDEQVKHLTHHWLKHGIKTAFSAQTYIENSLKKLEDMMGKQFSTYNTPMAEAAHPELDDSPLLDATDHSKFRSLIGCANWLVTLGRFDIAYSVNAYSRFSMQPRQGHLNGIIRVFGYLKKFKKGRIMIDPSYPDHSMFETKEYDNWKEFYPDAQELVPEKSEMPSPKGLPARITVYKDADHAHDVLTRRSVSGILLMINNTPVRWISKRQKTVETSTYGSELVCAKQAVELIMEYRYSLRMMGVPLDGPALMLGDNNSVVLNTTMPNSVLKKKHNACAYHRVREAIAAGIVKFSHIRSEMNYADILTKSLSSNDFHTLVKPLLFRVPN